jgi:ADP-ribose pyrophosphatase YjhB (NUDIX family)
MDNTPATYRISVKALITDNQGHILLLRHQDGSWELPGGGLELGEDAAHALAREVAEETGLSVSWMSDKPIAFWTIHKEVGSPTLKWFAFVLYEAKVTGELRLDAAGDEAHEANYFSKEDASALKLHNNTQPYFA